MDHDEEIMRGKWLIITVVVFFFSSCITWGEFVLMISGKETEADINSIYPTQVKTGRFSRSAALTVEYAFREPDGTNRKGMFNVSTDWQPPIDGKLKVVYTPGADGRARLAGRPNVLVLTFFFGTLAVMGFFAFKLWQEANEEYKPRRKR